MTPIQATAAAAIKLQTASELVEKIKRAETPGAVKILAIMAGNWARAGAQPVQDLAVEIMHAAERAAHQRLDELMAGAVDRELTKHDGEVN